MSPQTVGLQNRWGGGATGTDAPGTVGWGGNSGLEGSPARPPFPPVERFEWGLGSWPGALPAPMATRSIVPFPHATSTEQGLLVFVWPCVLSVSRGSSGAAAAAAGAPVVDGGGELMLLQCFAHAVGTGATSRVYEKLKPLIDEHGGSTPHMWVSTELTAARGPASGGSGAGGGGGAGGDHDGGGGGGGGEHAHGGFALFGSLSVKAESVTDDVLAIFQRAWTDEIRAVAELAPDSPELASLNKNMSSHARALLRSRRKRLSTPPGLGKRGNYDEWLREWRGRRYDD